jgi:anti-anti-sigma factor
VKISVSQEKNFKIIHVSGRIDWENAAELDNAVQQIIQDGFSRIVFELNRVEFICSGGIGSLVCNLKDVRKLGGDIYLIYSNEYLGYIFETLKFDVIFSGCIFPTLDALRTQIIEKMKP